MISRTIKLTTVYVAHSVELDNRHDVRAQGAAFFKFGAAASDSRAELEDRFNEGYAHRDGMRTMPLALCSDWVALHMWPGDEVVEGCVLNRLVPDCDFPFPHHRATADAVWEARTDGRAYGCNGIGDIRRIALADVKELEHRLKSPPPIHASAAAMVRTAIAHLHLCLSRR